MAKLTMRAIQTYVWTDVPKKGLTFKNDVIL